MQTSRLRFALFTIVCALSSTALALLSTSRYGIALSADSAAYISAARSMLAGHGFQMYTGDPYTSWPPLFPVVLGFASALCRVDPAIAGRWINALALGVVVSEAAILLWRQFQCQAFLAYVGILAIVLSSALLYTSIYLWSEPFFNILVLAFLICLQSYLRRASYLALLLLSIIAALACLQRYAGTALVITGGALLLLNPQKKVNARFRDSMLFGTISLLPLAAWVMRNHAVEGAFFGPRPVSVMALGQALRSVTNVVFPWFLPQRVASSPRILALAGGTICMLAALRAGRLRPNIRLRVSPIVPLITYVVVYTGLMVASTLVAGNVSPTDRTLAPIYVPLLLLLLIACDWMIVHPLSSRFTSNIMIALCTVIFVLWCVRPCLDLIGLVRMQMAGVQGNLATPAYQDSETLNYLEHHMPAAIYSNRPDAIYVATGLPARFVPNNAPFFAAKDGLRLDDLDGSWPPQPAYLVWLNGGGREYLFGLDEIASVALVTKVQAFRDGTIYTVAPKKN